MVSPDDFSVLLDEAIETACSPVVARLAALERQGVVHGRDGRDGKDGLGIQGERGEQGLSIIGPMGPTGPKGDDGKDADLDTLKALVDEAVAAAVLSEQRSSAAVKDALSAEIATLRAELSTAREVLAQVKGDIAVMTDRLSSLPTPRDGKDADPVVMQAFVDAAVARTVTSHLDVVVKALPRPEQGPPGPAGKDAEPIDMEAVIAGVAARIPQPKDGRDGVGLVGAVIDKDGHLILTMSDGSNQKLGRVNGADGKDGAPGLGFGDLACEFDGERLFSFKAVNGDRVLELGTFRVPVQIYRAIYEAGKKYESCDTVTWSGSMWHAFVDTTAKPGESRDWVQCVMRGKPGERGQKGEVGAQGERGQQGPAGQRYT